MAAYCSLINEELFDDRLSDMDDDRLVYCYHAECPGNRESCPYYVEDGMQLEDIENEEDGKMDEYMQKDVLIERARAGIVKVMAECDLPVGKNVWFTDDEIIIKALQMYCEELER